MIKVILQGCSGKMGGAITKLVEKEEEMVIVSGIDKKIEKDQKYPVYHSLDQCDRMADVVVDCSSKEAVKEVLFYCVNKKKPLVICTTGYSKEQMEWIQKASTKTAVFQSANMSEGINILRFMIRNTAPFFEKTGADIEIVETHHRQKKDVPSGTAVLLADEINQALGGRYVYDLNRGSGERKENEIGFSSVRGGTIFGEHEIIFAGEDEVIKIKHTAYSRNVFAKGVIKAVKFIAGKQIGLYDMDNMMEETEQ